MPSQHADPVRGFAFAMLAYLIWGLVVPIYMKSMSAIPALEIVAQRIVWAVPFAAAILLVRGRLGALAPVLRSPRTLALAALTATIISVNWGVYVHAIVSGDALGAALGYYINPLVNVLLGALFLGERPTRWQGVAILLAVAAVVILTVQAGGLPWISLVLAVSFGLYGLLRKVLPIGPAEGFLLEVLILSVPSLAFIGWAAASGTIHFGTSGRETWLLIGAGPLTAVPLILFAAGAKLLSFATVGILQYVAPTALFLTAVFIFGEPFSGWQLVAFVLIWAAVAIYAATLLSAGRRRTAAPEPLAPPTLS